MTTPRAYWGGNDTVLFEWPDEKYPTLRILWSVTGFLEDCTMSWENAVRYNGPLIPVA